MSQLELFEAPDPCINVCEYSPKGYCKGCMRSRPERFNWKHLDTSQKLFILKRCRQRYQRLLKRQDDNSQATKNAALHPKNLGNSTPEP